MQKLNIDILNIFLMLLSGIFAFVFPFQTFLFVYAFLGPLHYLTEINWLQQRNFFLKDPSKIYFLLVPIIFIGSIVYIPALVFFKPIIPFLIFFTFIISIFNSTEKETLLTNWKFMISIGVGIIATFYSKNHFITIFSILLPTLIHVFIFTGIFIVSGWLKTKKKWAKIAFLMYVSISLCLIVFNRNPTYFTDDIQNIYHSFEKLNVAVFSIFNKDVLANQDIYFSKFGIKLMQFIAFAYTYHYLNWFSKTSVIQWHKTSKLKLSLIISLWILSVLLYLYNYKLGLYWLYLLSLAHVILEFPLNITSVKNLFHNKSYQ